MPEAQEFKINKKYFHMMLWGWGLWSLMVVGVPFFIASIIAYKTTRIRVDDKGITYQRGWLSVTHRSIPFSRINNIDVKQGLVGRQMDYGNITLRTGNDAEAVHFIGVDRPFALKQIIDDKCAGNQAAS